ncbi:siderophore-interacting protein [Dactylosporangium fulvum]|uniref:Siderophore-interacting protein n=1 Tax=Dactylosporangium fulvum TaxID=53359 RepID=A0ABY5WA89_9ACTN|nr:siderophore-interacting protein [Dactylosporangium fulvum]UWP86980.1 siderophore-interacting protein [Dactylosporangium fulvum]
MTGDRTDPGSRVAVHQSGGSGVARVPYPIGVRRVAVAARRYLTPRMVRLTLAGPQLAGLHTYQCDDHVRIVFPDPDGTRRDPVPNDRDMLDWPHPMPVTRKYTIRRFCPSKLELDLDVVLHEGGVASTWAAGCAAGDPVTVAGPPGAKVFPHAYEHYVFAVDATALPAVARFLDEAPAGVSADVVVETGDGDLAAGYPLARRERVAVRWLPRSPGDRSALAAAVASLPLPSSRVFLFAAGETGDIAPLRTSPLDKLVTGYWKRGVAEFDH